MKKNAARIVVEDAQQEIDLSELPAVLKKRGRPAKKIVEPVVEKIPEQVVQPIQPVQTEEKEIDPESLTVLNQVRLAFSTKNFLALVIGSLWAGAIPVFSFIISHSETNIPDLFNTDGWTAKKILMSFFVLGALAFSFKSTFDFGKKIYFGDKIKAFGSTLILEGVLIFSGLKVVSIVSLALIVSANIIIAAVNLVVKKSNPDVDKLLGEK